MKRHTVSVRRIASIVTSVIAAFAVGFSLLGAAAGAAPISNESVTLGNSAPSTATTYSFTFAVGTSSTAIKSVGFQACTTASGTCLTPSGFSVTGTTIAQPTGLGAASGWTANTATAGTLELSDTSNATLPSASSTVVFSNVTNPSTTNTTFYLRITTYSDASWTTPIDTGVVATSTANNVQVTTIVDQSLTFTVSNTSVSLGNVSPSVTGSGTTQLTASTNAASGYAVTVAGNTLTMGANTITALSSGATSAQNTKQFGLNLANNTTPAVGAAETGGGTGTIAAGYGTANTFKFNASGSDTIASATAATNSNTYTVSYIANVDGLTPAGQYSTTLRYVATANF